MDLPFGGLSEGLAWGGGLVVCGAWCCFASGAAEQVGGRPWFKVGPNSDSMYLPTSLRVESGHWR